MDLHTLAKGSTLLVFKNTLSCSGQLSWFGVFCPNTEMKTYQWKDKSHPVLSIFLKNAVLTVTSVAGFVGIFWLKLVLTCGSNIEMFQNGLRDFQHCFLHGNNECAYDSKVHGLRSRKPLRPETSR